MEIECPNCKAKLQYDVKNPNRPFCSEQCKNKDFIGWADEKKSIPGSPDYDDLLSGELDNL